MNTSVTKTWTERKQAEIFQYIADLLAEGFQLPTILAFLIQIYPHEAPAFERMQERLLEGEPFYAVTTEMGVAPLIRFQLQTAETMGDFTTNIRGIAVYLLQRAEQKQKLRQVLAYPFLLILLVLGLLFGLRTFLLPQLMRFAPHEPPLLLRVVFGILEQLPTILLIVAVLIGAAVLVYPHVKARIGSLALFRLQVKLPLVGGLYRIYYTYLFAREFSQLFALGYSVSAISDHFASQSEVPLLQSVGEAMQSGYQEGKPLAEILTACAIFTPEFPAIIQRGELVSALAAKLSVYSRHCFSVWFKEVEKRTMQAQNALFIVVGLVVVTVYLTIMLPTFYAIGGL